MVVFLFNGINSDVCCTLTLDYEVEKVADIFKKEEVEFETYKGVSKKTFWLEPYTVKVFLIR